MPLKIKKKEKKKGRKEGGKKGEREGKEEGREGEGRKKLGTFRIKRDLRKKTSKNHHVV